MDLHNEGAHALDGTAASELALPISHQFSLESRFWLAPGVTGSVAASSSRRSSCRSARRPCGHAVAQVVLTLESFGVEFTNGEQPGVRLRKSADGR